MTKYFAIETAALYKSVIPDSEKEALKGYVKIALDDAVVQLSRARENLDNVSWLAKQIGAIDRGEDPDGQSDGKDGTETIPERMFASDRE